MIYVEIKGTVQAENPDDARGQLSDILQTFHEYNLQIYGAKYDISERNEVKIK